LPTEAIASGLAVLESQGVILCGSYTGRARKQSSKEWCDKRMLARIQRLTIQRLRKQVEPVSAATLNRFLFRWQRVGQDARLIGADGLRKIIEQVQGFESAAGAWEREILPARLHGYNPDWLDALCLSGQVCWARLSPKTTSGGQALSTPTKAAPLTLTLRDDMPWLRAAAEAGETESLSDNAQCIRDLLARRGASFLRDLVSSSELTAAAVEEALWELVAQGQATADGFTSLRLLIDRNKGETKSLFDAKGAAAKIASSRWRSTLKKSRKRDSSRGAHAHLSVAAAAGRWSLLEQPDAQDCDVMSYARQLLSRYGVVFRDLLVRESALPPWRDILQCLRRLEARGEIRGGRFVNGFVGEQFALPEAVTALRALRLSKASAPEIVTLAATDPLNLVGITSPGSKVPAVMGNKVLYRDGTPIAALESGELIMRETLEDDAYVDTEFRYHGPTRNTGMMQQELLPLR
jgi:ATP-dependent Lhr-like helicase